MFPMGFAYSSTTKFKALSIAMNPADSNVIIGGTQTYYSYGADGFDGYILRLTDLGSIEWMNFY